MLKPESFDSILMLWTFAYTEFPEKLVSEIKRLLKPNGNFFIITYAEKFRKKHSYILDGTDHKFYLTKTKAKYFTLDFEDVRIEGFRFFDVPRFYNLNIGFIKIFLTIDKFFQNIFQNKCYYLIIKGRKG